MNAEKATNIFWLFLGLLIMEESYRLDLGRLRAPDSGLFPFFIGGVITVLSLILLSRAFKYQPLKQGNINYRNLLSTLSLLYGYVLIFEFLGFMISTFLLIFSLLKVVERKGWVMALIVASLSSYGAHLLFEVWLHAALPRGILGI